MHNEDDKIDRQSLAPHDEHSHGGMDRRAFLVNAAALGGVTLAQGVLPHYAEAQTPPKSDPQLYEAASVNEPRFGAKGDGSTDDTAALRLAFAWLRGGATRALSFAQGGTYLVSARIHLAEASQFAIFGNGATIKARNQMPVAGETELLYFTTCTDGYIENLRVDGNRANRKISSPTTSHSVVIGTSCARLTFQNCQSDNAVCDGWLVLSVTPTVVASLPTDIHFIRCSGKNAYRNVLSLIDSNRFRDSRGSYKGANGVPPQCGVDVEPDLPTNQGNLDVVFQDTECSDNVGFGLQIAHSNSHVRVSNIVANGNGQGAVNHAGGSCVLDGGFFKDYRSGITFGVVTSTVDAGKTEFRHLKFENCVINHQDHPLVLTRGNGTQPQYVRDVSAHTCAGTVVRLNADRNYASDVKATRLASTSAAIIVTGAHCAVQGVELDHASGADRSILVTGADVVIDGVNLLNPGVLNAGAIEFASGALRGTAQNISIKQGRSIPRGQIGVKFNEIPLVCANISAHSVGTDYTNANVVQFVAGASGAKVANIRPSGP